MNINSFEIDTSKMSSPAQVRLFTVTGDIGASFQILAIQNPSSSSTHTLYYDFISKSFESGHNDLNNNLLVTLSSNIYRNSIVFPEGGGEYVIKLISTNSTNQKIITRSISKITTGLATLTFSPATTANASSYETFPTTQVDGAFESTGKKEAEWSIQNKEDDANGFGLISNADFYDINFSNTGTNTVGVSNIQDAWFFQTTEIVQQTVTSGTQIIVDDLTDIIVGMEIHAVSAGSLTGTPRVIEIIRTGQQASGVFTGIIVIDSAQTFADGITLTFRAYGPKAISKAIGAYMKFLPISITPAPLEKRVRGAVSNSTNITLSDTYGIAGGSKVSYKGLNVNNTTSNLITQVSTADADGSGSDGVVVCQLNQTLSDSTVLTFKGSHAKVTFKYGVEITSFPETNRTINLDIDKFLTPGVSGT